MASSADGVTIPFRFTRSMALLAAFTTWSAVWVAGASLRWWAAPLLGWLVLPATCAVVAGLCRRTATDPGQAAATRRFWRYTTASAVLLGLGSISNMMDALTGPVAPSQQLGPRSLVLYVGAVLAGQCGLLTIPAQVGAVGGWWQFTLDSGAVTVTVTVFAWHFSFRHLDQWTAVTGSVGPMLAIIVVAFASIVAFVKTTAAGTGPLDRSAMRLIAVATLASALVGSVTPMLLGRPEISATHCALPLGLLLLGLAADRQRRTTGRARPGPARHKRKWSLLPYAAVVATNALLLVENARADGPYLVVGAVTLTAIVVVRQILAFADNTRLLATVDASVRDLSRVHDQLAFQANHDELTGLPNRRLLQQRVAEALGRYPSGSVHLAIVDLDDFKTVNDRLGHHVGDELLGTVADRLIALGGPQMSVFRLGGDEFAILLAPSTSARADAELDEVVEVLRRPIVAAGHELLVPASIGLTDGLDAHEARELLRRADVAMYEAKERGKGRVTRFDVAMDLGAAEGARIGTQLRSAVERRELHLAYQPIVELPHGRIVGAEALVRWNSPDGPVPPNVFVPIAEHNGLIVTLGDWILREACRQAALWRRVPGVHSIDRISVNVSARQLKEPNFAATVADALLESGLPASRLTVEVTETAVFGGGVALESLDALHRLGVRIALDDFGTGHSSLGLLRTCPVDVLKVDKSFVDEVTTPGEQSVIAAALIQIATGLHLDAVAEGVEHAEQADRLYQLGYRFAQGYHFARPMPAVELTARLAASPAVASPAIA